MKNIDTGPRPHCIVHVAEGGKEETIEGIQAHFVILDLAALSGLIPLVGFFKALVLCFIVHVIGRVRDNEVQKLPGK